MIGMKSVINVLKEPDQEHHVQTIVAARKQTERFYFVVEAILEKVAAYVAQRTGYETVLVESMLVSELLAYLSGSPLPPKDVLAARRKGCAFHFGSSMTAFDTAEAEVLKTALFSKNTSVIRGTCAYPGFISGRAVIITDYARESDKLKQGDILVTGMTDPNFLPVMTKAAAILVDTGGLLSHAAISARELRVPCVIGLECATAILKDGDLVEADAAGVLQVFGQPRGAQLLHENGLLHIGRVEIDAFLFILQSAQDLEFLKFAEVHFVVACDLEELVEAFGEQTVPARRYGYFLLEIFEILRIKAAFQFLERVLHFAEVLLDRLAAVHKLRVCEHALHVERQVLDAHDLHRMVRNKI
jgi:phosphohistidine swiveling domain-containing protein